jgi:AraC family transcriptional regulator of adaptative response/methylated-DNA-[protein]-cysteine methyltransferase
MFIINRINTPLGEMTAGATRDGICLLEFGRRDDSDPFYNEMASQFGTTVSYGSNKHISDLRHQLKEYFNGGRKEFNIPLVMKGTEFQEKVWNGLLKIAYGETISYARQAVILKNPRLVRAVAHANGMNRIAIIVPCHRVLGSDGKLVGYGGGLEKKRWLIDHEKRNTAKPVEQTLF